MKYGYMMTAVLAGAMVVGCDKSKDQTKMAAEPTHAAPNNGMSGQTPTTPDTTAHTSMQNAGDQMKAMGQNAKDATKNAGNALGAGMDKMRDKMGGGAATQPAVPVTPAAPAMPQ